MNYALGDWVTIYKCPCLVICVFAIAFCYKFRPVYPDHDSLKHRVKNAVHCSHFHLVSKIYFGMAAKEFRYCHFEGSLSETEGITSLIDLHRFCSFKKQKNNNNIQSSLCGQMAILDVVASVLPLTIQIGHFY